MTPSELHVARLAAAGLSNADIARQRATSVRTVANQMQRVLRELRLPSRRALPLVPDLQAPVPESHAVAWTTLSEREASLLARASRGELQKSIAIEIGVAQSTVSSTLHAARRRLGFATVTQLAIAYASRTAS